MYALNEDGKPIPWWFAYKFPESVYVCKTDPATYVPSSSDKVSVTENDGYRYLYYEPGVALDLSPHSLSPDGASDGAITRTLAQVFATGVADTVGWMAYNDEHPTQNDLTDANAPADEVAASDSSSFGHCKGVIGFDMATGTGFWLIHSFPRWPAEGQTRFPPNDQDEGSRLTYAQTFICHSIPDLESVENVADMLRSYHTPQVLYSRMPSGADTTLPTLTALIAENSGSSPPKKDDTRPGELTFQARVDENQGVTFQLFAKDGAWGKDFWTELVSHRLGEDFEVESWRRDSKTVRIPGQDDGDGDEVFDGSGVYWSGRSWFFKETDDHAKWGVGKDASSELASVGDINRQTSQEKRGGGAVVVRDLTLAKTLRSMIILMTPEAEAKETASASSSSSNSATAAAGDGADLEASG